MHMKLHRYLKNDILDFLGKKMVFLGGPRQVGKTTLAVSFLNPPSVKSPQYLNWDSASDRKIILSNEIKTDKPILVFDEIHKYNKWRNFVKGLYDKNHEDLKILVTGSARLDHFRKGGDSLLGRYRYLRIHPLTISEIKASHSDIESLIKFGGFPEPFVEQKEKIHKLWINERNYRIVRDDIKDLTTIKETSMISLLIELLPARVGSPLSLKSLSEDLQVSQPSVDRWILALENLYYCYRIAPFGSPKIRAVKKLQKLYLWDWSEIQDLGSKFENFVASHLLKYCHYLEDTEGEKMELRYLRDTDGHEIDFVVLKNKKPIFAVECKTGDKSISKSIHFYKDRTPIPEFYQVHLGQKDYGSAKTGRVLPFKTFCEELGLK